MQFIKSIFTPFPYIISAQNTGWFSLFQFFVHIIKRRDSSIPKQRLVVETKEEEEEDTLCRVERILEAMIYFA